MWRLRRKQFMSDSSDRSVFSHRFVPALRFRRLHNNVHIAEIQKALWEYFVIKLPACSLENILRSEKRLTESLLKLTFQAISGNGNSLRSIECSVIFKGTHLEFLRLLGNLLQIAGISESLGTHVIAECNGRVKQPINRFERQIALRSDGSQDTVLLRVLSSSKTNKTVLFIFRVVLGHEPVRK